MNRTKIDREFYCFLILTKKNKKWENEDDIWNNLQTELEFFSVKKFAVVSLTRNAQVTFAE